MKSFRIALAPAERLWGSAKLLIVGFLLLSAAPRAGNAQAAPAGSAAADTVPWRGWAFFRAGVASSAPVSVATSGGSALISVGAGVAASHGPGIGMVRFTDNEGWSGAGVGDWAVLAGARSSGDHLFVSGATGVAQVTPFPTSDAGTATGGSRVALAYDVSAHAAFTVVGLALSLSGTVGPPKTSYLAVSLGVEFGRFGR